MTVKREGYRKEWQELGPLLVRMIRKDGRCNHALGDTFCYRHPYDKPGGICMALWHVLEFYAWRVELGFPSWEAGDPAVYRLHCPSSTGTVWEMRKVLPGEQVPSEAAGSVDSGVAS
jgi:uncharacterized repeat protein (TIGR04076 family)